jgi:hypothetical protein
MRFACYPIVMRCLKNPDYGHRPDQEIDTIHEFRFSDAGASGIAPIWKRHSPNAANR